MPKIIGNLKGNVSENMAIKFLVKRGYFIVWANYVSYYGEIDIIAYKMGTIHFFEVKSVTHVTNRGYSTNISHETSNCLYLPHFNMSSRKLDKIAKTAEVFINDNMLFMKHWQINLVSVIHNYSVNRVKSTSIKIFYNVI